MSGYVIGPLPKTEAQWSISLDCDCPHCKEYVDLTDQPEFWEDTEIKPGEHFTNRSRNLRVYCPECGEEFLVDLQY